MTAAGKGRGAPHRLARRAAGPLRAYFNPRFEALAEQIAALSTRIDEIDRPAGALAAELATVGAQVESILDVRSLARLEQARQLDRVDVRDQNRLGRPPSFDVLESQATSAQQCEHARCIDWYRLLENIPDTTAEGQVPEGAYNRKVWEWAYIAEAVQSLGLLKPGYTALGFGCGTEPMPALFARFGLDVLATDQASDEGQQDWRGTGQLMGGVQSLSRPHIVADDVLAERVRVRAVDMNDVPDDIGSYDVIWSSCVIEHLGSPQRGMDFVLESAQLLKPGGVMVHTTELELTVKPKTADYGNCAVYRLVDLEALVGRVVEAGFEMTLNPYVALDTPQDRWISMAMTGYAGVIHDDAHLRLVIGDSVSTSFGLLVRRPA